MTEAAVAARKTLLTRQVALARLSRENVLGEQSLREKQRDVESNKGLAAVLVRLSEREQRELDEIDAALKRIDAGSWGRCDACGAQIKAERLAALPEARKCLSCAG